jgi:hypothetical protein
MDRTPQFGWLVICYRLGAFAASLSLITSSLSSICSRFVALKICIADNADGSREARVLQFLADHNTGEGSQHVLNLLDNFQIEGPNGSHEVLVTEVLVPLSALALYPVYEKVL